jgi:hypothetical protein
VEHSPGVSAEELGGRLQGQTEFLTPASEHQANVGDLICPMSGLQRDTLADRHAGRTANEIGEQPIEAPQLAISKGTFAGGSGDGCGQQQSAAQPARSDA